MYSEGSSVNSSRKRSALRPSRGESSSSPRGGEDLQIALDQHLDPGPLHLDDDLLAAGEDCAVHLTDGRRRRGDGVEFCKDLLRRRAQFPGDDGGDLFGSDRWGGILQLAQLRHIVCRYEVGTRTQDLPQLDEGGPEILKRQPHLLSPAGRAR